jgi:hypothetical protein
LNFLDSYSKNIQILNFMKIRPMGAELFHAGGQRHDETYKLKKLKVARRGLYSTAVLCIADCALAFNGVPSFISRGATTPSGAGAVY